MKKALAIILLLISVSCMPGTQSQPSRFVDNEKNLDRLLDGTVALVLPQNSKDHIPFDKDTRGKVHQAYCSGVVVSKKHVLTASHCLSFMFDITLDIISSVTGKDFGKKYVKVSFRNHQIDNKIATDYYVLYEIEKRDVEKDLALLKILPGQPNFATNVLKVSPRKKVKRNERIFIVGNPSAAPLKGNLLWSLTSGRVIKPKFKHEDHPFRFSASAQIVPGNSGGPAIDDYGYVVGIVQVFYFGSNYLTGLAHPEEIHNFLEIYQNSNKSEND